MWLNYLYFPVMLCPSQLLRQNRVCGEMFKFFITIPSQKNSVNFYLKKKEKRKKKGSDSYDYVQEKTGCGFPQCTKPSEV